MSILNSSQPPYIEISNIIRDRIRTNIYCPGDKLPSYVSIAKTFKVAPNTAKAAIRVLKEEGLVIVQHGRGIFVKGKN
jgi:GntR family transcriptional regulator